MNKKDKVFLIILIFIAVGLTLTGVINKIYEDNHYKKYYTYIDLDNNEGIAYNCQYTDKSYRSGGMGTPICELNDGTIITVKSYKYHKEKLDGKGE